jgi:hypothetical protein
MVSAKVTVEPLAPDRALQLEIHAAPYQAN